MNKQFLYFKNPFVQDYLQKYYYKKIKYCVDNYEQYQHGWMMRYMIYYTRTISTVTFKKFNKILKI